MVALSAQAGRREFGHAGRRRVEMPARVGRLDAVFGMEAQPDAGADREDLVRLRFFQEQPFQLAKPLRLLRRKVVGLREISLEIVEFPNVLVRIPRRQSRAHREPRRQRPEGAGEPAVVIDAAAAVVVEVLRVLARRRLGVGERVDNADAVDRILLEAVNYLRRLDAENLVDGRRDVVDVMELRPRRLVRLDARWPGDGHRVARAAEMRCDQLGVLERRVAGPRPAGVIHVVDLRSAERLQPADLVQRLDLLLDRVRDLVLREQFADAPVLAFGTGAVVAEDVDDDGVVADAESVELVDQLAGLNIDMLDEASEYLHQPPLERPFRLRECCPSRAWFRLAA